MATLKTTDEAVAEFRKLFVDENLWKSDDQMTANVPIGNIEAWLRALLESKDRELVDAVNRLRDEPNQCLACATNGHPRCVCLTLSDDAAYRLNNGLAPANETL